MQLFLKSVQHFEKRIAHVLVRNCGLEDDWSSVEEMEEVQNAVKKYEVKMIDFPKFYLQARLFGIPWHSLPAIVVSTNIWQLEHVICPTSSEHLEVQLNELARLPDKYGVPNIGHIVTTLEAICGDQVDYHPPNESTRQRLRTFYSILNTFDRERGLESTDYRYELGRQLDAVENSLDSLRRNFRSQQFEDQDILDLEVADAVIEDAAGRFIAPASVAAKVLRDLQNSVELPDILDDESAVMLDDESAVMIETSLTVGSFLESLAENSLGGFGPLGRRKPQGGYGKNSATRQPNPMLDIDFTPGAQGAWKAFELEVNLSMIQAARAVRDIVMPTYFTLYDPALPFERGIVETGRRRNRAITVDINQLDWSERSSGRHRFISLGDALHLVRAMIDSPNEKLDLVIQQAIGESLPERVLDAWKEIFRVRNRGSHVHRLNQQDYERVLQSALAPDVLRTLLKIKGAILQGRIL